MNDETHYRLSWEMPWSIQVDKYEQLYGRHCWPRLDWDSLNLDWHETSVEFVGDARMQQYNTLKQWAESREQPIRNVRLERREVRVTEWVPA